VIVVDASCVVEVLLRTDAADSIESRWQRDGSLHAPEVIDLEILQVMRRLVALREVSEDRAALALGMHAVWIDGEGLGLPDGAPVRPHRIVRAISELM